MQTEFVDFGDVSILASKLVVAMWVIANYCRHLALMTAAAWQQSILVRANVNKRHKHDSTPKSDIGSWLEFGQKLQLLSRCLPSSND